MYYTGIGSRKTPPEVIDNSVLERYKKDVNRRFEHTEMLLECSNKTTKTLLKVSFRQVKDRFKFANRLLKSKDPVMDLEERQILNKGRVKHIQQQLRRAKQLEVEMAEIKKEIQENETILKLLK